jgi:hypothetical protein
MTVYEQVNYVIYFIYNVCLVCIASILTWAGIDHEAFYILTLLILIDYITGLGKCYRLKLNQTSYTIVAKLSLILVPLAVALTSKGLEMNAELLVFVAMDILILSELYSIIGNIYTIRSGNLLPEYDAIALLANKIKNLMIKLSGSKETDVEQDT